MASACGRAVGAGRWVPDGARVLDIGCFHGEFLDRLGERIAPSVGMDPLAATRDGARHALLPQRFEDQLPFEDGTFDAVAMLATFEHIQGTAALARECARVLRPGGVVVITVPSPRVDTIVETLVRLRLADGMSLDEHHGYDPSETPALFDAAGCALVHRQRFQLGLNYLFVFRKTASDCLVS